jgi:hypothetical protein
MIYRILNRKLEIKEHKPHWKPGVNLSAPEEWPVPAPHAAPLFFTLVVVTNPVIRHGRGKD